MQKIILAIIPLAALAANATAADGEAWEGNYVNGKVTISWEVGARGRSEFVSSACANKPFSPRKNNDGKFIGERKEYTITSDGGYTRLIVTGKSACLPEGVYNRAN